MSKKTHHYNNAIEEWHQEEIQNYSPLPQSEDEIIFSQKNNSGCKYKLVYSLKDEEKKVPVSKGKSEESVSSDQMFRDGGGFVLEDLPSRTGNWYQNTDDEDERFGDHSITCFASVLMVATGSQNIRERLWG